MKVYVRKDRATRTRTVRGVGREPPWSEVRRRITRLEDGTVLEDVVVTHVQDQSDRAWIYDLPNVPDRDKVYAYGYTTLGRFYDRSEKVDDGAVRLYLLPQETGRGELWVVFEDEEGGTFVWNKPFRVR